VLGGSVQTSQAPATFSMSRTADLTAERIARNDAAFRAANERIRARAEEAGRPTRIPFLCECAREDCTEIVWLTPDVYEAIRADPRHFFNAPGHDRFGGHAVEVVRDAGSYLVIQKVGRAAEVVEALDPRRED
jgi:hypothetical protein